MSAIVITLLIGVVIVALVHAWGERQRDPEAPIWAQVAIAGLAVAAGFITESEVYGLNNVVQQERTTNQKLSQVVAVQGAKIDTQQSKINAQAGQIDQTNQAAQDALNAGAAAAAQATDANGRAAAAQKSADEANSQNQQLSSRLAERDKVIARLQARIVSDAARGEIIQFAQSHSSIGRYEFYSPAAVEDAKAYVAGVASALNSGGVPMTNQSWNPSADLNPVFGHTTVIGLVEWTRGVSTGHGSISS